MTDVVIIGGGAAGLICAATAAKDEASVLVIDKNNRLARKLLITGKGRCNVTNNCTSDDFIKEVCTNPRFMYSAINEFTPQDTMALFESLGVKLKTERGNRVFPCSDKAVDIVDALVKYAMQNGVKTKMGCVKQLVVENGQLVGIQTEKELLSCRKAVIATGGMSYPLTGSDGSGYALAQSVGHTIVKPIPSLVPIITKESFCKDLMGLSLKNVVLSVMDQKNRKVYSEMGEMLFTHFGISGPLVLSASSHMKGNLCDYTIAIDLKPALDERQLDARVLRDFAKNNNRDFFNCLGELLPRKLIPVMVDLSGIDRAAKIHSITKEQRLYFVKLLKQLTLTPKAFRPIDEAIITSGGVNVKEVNPKTMESKLVKGLYFAGEVLDVDAYTGGYNLQIAFSTGVVAGKQIKRGI